MRYQDYHEEWPWPNFKPKEVACKHCGELWEGEKPMPKWFHESMEALQYLRDLWGKALIINSGHRCAEHNAAVSLLTAVSPRKNSASSKSLRKKRDSEA